MNFFEVKFYKFFYLFFIIIIIKIMKWFIPESCIYENVAFSIIYK